jgi:hypothetical protein
MKDTSRIVNENTILQFARGIEENRENLDVRLAGL